MAVLAAVKGPLTAVRHRAARMVVPMAARTVAREAAAKGRLTVVRGRVALTVAPTVELAAAPGVGEYRAGGRAAAG
jgi:hypothetical protein